MRAFNSGPAWSHPMLTIMPRKYPHPPFMNLWVAKKNFFWKAISLHLSKWLGSLSKFSRDDFHTCFAQFAARLCTA